MKKILSMLAVLVIVLAGCGTDNSGTNESLVIYSNSADAGRDEWLIDRAAEDGFDLEVVELGGGDLYNRLLAEKNAPIADVIFGLDDMMFMDLKNEDMLLQYSPSWLGDIDQSLVDAGDGYYAPLVQQRIVMVYNPEFYDEDSAPKDWQDLATNPEFKDKYFIPTSISGGTDQKVFMSMLLQYQDSNQEMGISDEGWSLVNQYVANGYATPESEDQWQNFKEGKTPIGYTYSSGIQGYEETYDMNINVVNPPSGVITMNEQIGIVDKGDKTDYTTAKEFIDWFGSSTIQGEWAEEFGTMPVSAEAAESETDTIKKISEDTTPMDVDWSFINDNIDDWMEKIELEVLK